jgi:integrase/recombinase XerC
MSGEVIPLHPERLPEDDTYEAFLSFFLGERAKSTSQAYLKDISYLGKYLGLGEVVEVVRFLLESSPLLVNLQIQEWRRFMTEDSTLAPSSTNRRLSTIRALLHTARSLGLTSVELSTKNVPGGRIKDVRGPDPDTITKMLETLSHDDSPKAARDLNIIFLAYSLGMRRNEIRMLDVEHVDLQASRISIQGKGRGQHQREEMTLPTTLRDSLASWLRHRGHAKGALFLNLSSNSKGERLSGTSVYRIARQAGELVGSPTIVRPHGLRRSAINQAIASAGIREVCAFSRHRDLRSLQQYLDPEESAQADISSALAAGLDIANGTGAPGEQSHEA